MLMHKHERQCAKEKRGFSPLAVLAGKIREPEAKDFYISAAMRKLKRGELGGFEQYCLLARREKATKAEIAKALFDEGCRHLKNGAFFLRHRGLGIALQFFGEAVENDMAVWKPVRDELKIAAKRGFDAESPQYSEKCNAKLNELWQKSDETGKKEWAREYAAMKMAADEKMKERIEFAYYEEISRTIRAQQGL